MELTLTPEHWLDIREAIQRRLKEVGEAKPESPIVKQEQARRINSLKESLDRIESAIKDAKFEQEQNPLPF